MSSQSAHETVFQLLGTLVMKNELETGDEFRGTEMQQRDSSYFRIHSVK
jgi:hypothetical protein